jgi:hypothetical protein
VSDNNSFTDKQLDILHDHYKETFARLREAEGLRDKLFLWVIALFALLCVEIGYPAAIGGSLGSLNVAGGEFHLQALPLPALLNVTWVLILTISLRYCQISVLVIRQYPYLHLLEETMSPHLGGGDLYQREGKVYLRGYPLLLDVAWFAYHVLFPIIVITAACSLVVWEFNQLSYPVAHKIFDITIASALTIFFFLYRVQPFLASGLEKWRIRLSHNKQATPQNIKQSNKFTKSKKP